MKKMKVKIEKQQTPDGGDNGFETNNQEREFKHDLRRSPSMVSSARNLHLLHLRVAAFRSFITPHRHGRIGWNPWHKSKCFQSKSRPGGTRS